MVCTGALRLMRLEQSERVGVEGRLRGWERACGADPSGPVGHDRDFTVYSEGDGSHRRVLSRGRK